MYETKVAWGKLCDQGWVQIVRTEEGRYFCLCEECETQWDHPEDAKRNVNSTFGRWTTAKSVSLDEAGKIDWQKYIIGS